MEILSRQDFLSLTPSFVGLPVSHTWNGIGSTIFLELGSLSNQTFKDRPVKNQKVEYTIQIDWDWRIESAQTVVGGSSASKPDIAQTIAALIGDHITACHLTDPISELVVSFGSGKRLQTFAANSGDPQWTIRLPGGNIVWVKDGTLLKSSDDDPPSDPMTEAERASSEFAETTYRRWEPRFPTHPKGSCRACEYFIPLDGNFSFLACGVCINQESSHDGQVVGETSSCPKFLEEQ